MKEQIEFRILDESGLCVVSVSGPQDRARGEINHYAMQYVKDGPITIQSRTTGGRWITCEKWKSTSGKSTNASTMTETTESDGRTT